MDDLLFDRAAEAVRTLVPPELGTVRLRVRRWSLKAWFGPVEPTREHYEAQILGRQHVPEPHVLGLEIGLHAEHRDPLDNDACLARLDAAGGGWRDELGSAVEVGGFIGRPEQWRRVSEVWLDPDLSDDELAWEIGARVTDYIVCLEPLRSTSAGAALH